MYRKVAGLIMVVAALAGIPGTAQAASSTVSIAVPPTQQLEGSTVITITPGASIQRGRLVVKSNVPWMLVAHAATEGLIWSSSSTRQVLGTESVVLRGAKGVHTVEFEVRLPSPVASGEPAMQITFTVAPVR